MGPDERDCLGEETGRPPKVNCMGECQWSFDRWFRFFIWYFKPVGIEVIKKSKISGDLFSCVGQ